MPATSNPDPSLDTHLQAFLWWWSDHGHAASTGEQYCREMRHLAAHGHLLPPNLSLAQAREYVRHRWPNAEQVESAKITIRALKAFSRWRAEEYEDPDLLRFPHSPTPVGGVVAQERDVESLILMTAQDKSFTGKRDTAMISVMWANGMRRSDVARMTTDDIDMKAGLVWIRKSKNGESRTALLSRRATAYRRAYVVVRSRHKFAADAALWLSQRRHNAPTAP